MNYFLKLFALARSHRKISVGAVIGLTVIGYYAYGHYFGSTTETRYILGSVVRGTIISSVSGTGQVSASDQIDVKPKVSGDIVYVGVVKGQKVTAGTTMFILDSGDAQKKVRDAQLAYDNAKITLAKFNIEQGSTQETRTKDLDTAYTDGLNLVSTTMLDLSSIMDGIYNPLYADTLQGGCHPNLCQYGNYISDSDALRVFNNLSRTAESDYAATKSAYDAGLESYRNVRLMDAKPEELKSMLNSTLNILKLATQTVKSEQNMLDYLVEQIKEPNVATGKVATVPAQITLYQSQLSSLFSTINSKITSTNSSINTIDKREEAIRTGTMGDPLDLADQQNNVEQKKATLDDAKETLANYTIRTPLSGYIAEVKSRKGDSVTGSTVMATVITDKQIAQLSLNEVDAVKVELGQKVMLTFDAIDGLTISGKVIEVDELGTVSQGVVNYTSKVGFDTQDVRVKPGMSVAASIINDTRPDVLIVPSAAIKRQGDTSYVELVPSDVNAEQLMKTDTTGTGVTFAGTPRKQNVTTGLSDDTQTEITQGLNENDIIIEKVKTISTTAATTNSAQNARGLGGFIGR
jgi:HlyD family secretion protein